MRLSPDAAGVCSKAASALAARLPLRATAQSTGKWRNASLSLPFALLLHLLEPARNVLCALGFARVGRHDHATRWRNRRRRRRVLRPRGSGPLARVVRLAPAFSLVAHRAVAIVLPEIALPEALPE